MIYCYWIARGLASLHKMQSNGNDCDDKPKKIGSFASDDEAKQACIKHYEKACKMALTAGRDKPQIKFI